ncbi:MAG: hypothetical protein KF823_01385 [Xanthomonadales bacterium]|nr:hypothetical protein [Xanthomonadales bacterium]
MEYRIVLDRWEIEPEQVRQALAALDPAALADLSAGGRLLRIATTLDADTVRARLAQAGLPDALGQLVLAPSVCCGGCSG